MESLPIFVPHSHIYHSHRNRNYQKQPLDLDHLFGQLQPQQRYCWQTAQRQRRTISTRAVCAAQNLAGQRAARSAARASGARCAARRLRSSPPALARNSSTPRDQSSDPSRWARRRILQSSLKLVKLNPGNSEYLQPTAFLVLRCTLRLCRIREAQNSKNSSAENSPACGQPCENEFSRRLWSASEG